MADKDDAAPSGQEAAGAEGPQQKSAKQLKKEAKKNAKMAKFNEKMAKLGAQGQTAEVVFSYTFRVQYLRSRKPAPLFFCSNHYLWNRDKGGDWYRKQ